MPLAVADHPEPHAALGVEQSADGVAQSFRVAFRKLQQPLNILTTFDGAIPLPFDDHRWGPLGPCCHQWLRPDYEVLPHVSFRTACNLQDGDLDTDLCQRPKGTARVNFLRQTVVGKKADQLILPTFPIGRVEEDIEPLKRPHHQCVPVIHTRSLFFALSRTQRC